jgi:hypothetical protein
MIFKPIKIDTIIFFSYFKNCLLKRSEKSEKILEVKSDKNCLLFQVEESEKSSKMVVVGWYRR